MKLNRAHLIIFIIFSLSIFMGFTIRGCDLLNLVFFSECTIDPEINSNGFGWLFKQSGPTYIANGGKIYVPKEYCGSGYELFLVSGEPDLNSIDAIGTFHPTSIIVGDNGTIIRHNLENPYQFIIINSPTQNNLNHITRRSFSDNIYIAVGDAGTIIKSTDDGLTWNFINFPNSNNLVFCYVTGDTIFVSGYDYTFYKSTNDGQSWIPVGPALEKLAGSQSSYNVIYFHDDNLGFVGGPHGLILKTTDGGNFWQSKVAQGFSEVYDIYFISEDSGAAVGPGGVARFTTDGGDTWFEDESVTNHLDGRDVKKIVPFGKYYGTVVGSGGLSTFIAPDSTYLDSIGGVTSIEDDLIIPSEFALLQNYPNPFNPTTTLSFEISHWSFVSLKVYDLLGKEVAALVNEEKPAGVYKVEFDASELSSGMYYYQLTADDFKETKKLVLIK